MRQPAAGTARCQPIDHLPTDTATTAATEDDRHSHLQALGGLAGRGQTTTAPSRRLRPGPGLAVDLNAFQNPYRRGDLVLPELAGAYLDRGRARPGMIHPGDVVTKAFAAIGWTWGGTWRSPTDDMHFSATGR